MLSHVSRLQSWLFKVEKIYICNLGWLVWMWKTGSSYSRGSRKQLFKREINYTFLKMHLLPATTFHCLQERRSNGKLISIGTKFHSHFHIETNNYSIFNMEKNNLGSGLYCFVKFSKNSMKEFGWMKENCSWQNSISYQENKNWEITTLKLSIIRNICQ